jgi:hypothetical protein
MQIPGEALLGKLWDTLTDKAIGNLLKPWQIRREGKALIDLKREEMLVLAQAEQDADAIRRGVTFLPRSDGEHQLLLPRGVHANEPPNAADVVEIETRSEKYAELARAANADILRKEVNVAKAILHAETTLEPETQPPNADHPSDDWIYRWRDYASTVSHEELQLLWGRVLAGEVKAPGTFSLRFLNFLNNLGKHDAQLIATAMPYVISDFISRETNEHLERAGLTFANLLLLQELGILTGVDGLGLRKTFSALPGQRIRMLLRSHGIGIGFEAPEGTSSLEIAAYVVTGLGQQLARLGNFQADLPYLEGLGLFIKSKGFSVEMGRLYDLPNGETHLVQARAL